MNIDFKKFEIAEEVALPLDFAMLYAALGAAQAASPTGRIAAVVNDDRAALTQTEHAIVLLRKEQGWRVSLDAMHGNFHAAAEHINDKLL